MSRQAADGNMEGMKESLSFALRLTLFITIPAMVGLILCATPIMSLIFMGGQFDFRQATGASEALWYYSLGLSFVAMTRVLAPVFYALKDTKTPVITAFIAFFVNLSLSLLLMGPLKHGGLALATTLSALCNMLMLFWLLRRRVGSFGGVAIITSALKSAVATVPMGIAVWFGCSLIEWSQAGHKLLKGSVLGGSIASGCLIYMVTVKLLRSEEAIEAVSLLRRKLKRG